MVIVFGSLWHSKRNILAFSSENSTVANGVRRAAVRLTWSQMEGGIQTETKKGSGEERGVRGMVT